MLTLLITLFVISIIEFGIFLFLEYMSMRRNNKQKLNDNEYDKLNTNYYRFLLRDSEDSRENDKTE